MKPVWNWTLPFSWTKQIWIKSSIYSQSSCLLSNSWKIAKNWNHAYSLKLPWVKRHRQFVKSRCLLKIGQSRREGLFSWYIFWQKSNTSASSAIKVFSIKSWGGLFFFQNQRFWAGWRRLGQKRCCRYSICSYINNAKSH